MNNTRKEAEKMARALKGKNRVFWFAVQELELDEKTDQMAVKCGGCRYSTSSLFAHGESREKVKNRIEDGEIGICGRCYAEMLAEDGFYVEKP